MKKKLILVALTVVLTLGVALVITGCGEAMKAVLTGPL